MSVTPALQAYRQLLRASRTVFDKDIRMLKLSLRQIRTEFEKNRFEKDANRITQLVSDANQTATFIVASVVQGVKEKEEEGFKLRLNKKQVETNLDASMNIKPIDEQIESLERRAARKKKPTTSEEECCSSEASTTTTQQ